MPLHPEHPLLYFLWKITYFARLTKDDMPTLRTFRHKAIMHGDNTIEIIMYSITQLYFTVFVYKYYSTNDKKEQR